MVHFYPVDEFIDLVKQDSIKSNKSCTLKTTGWARYRCVCVCVSV